MIWPERKINRHSFVLHLMGRRSRSNSRNPNPKITVKVKGGSKGGQKKPKSKVKVVVSTKQKRGNRQPTGAQRMRVAMSRGAAPMRSRAMSLPGGYSKEARSVALSTLLPYEASPLRLRADAGDSYAMTSAVAKHFNYYDLNVSELVAQNLVCGILPGGRPVWPDLDKQVNVVSILDAKVWGIVPSAKPIAALAIQPRYLVRSFMNANQVSPGKFRISNMQLALPGGAAAVSVERKVNGGEPMDLYFDDWPYSSGPIECLGPKMVAVDYAGKRCVWIDSIGDGGTVQTATIVYVLFNTSSPVQLVNNQSLGGATLNGNESTLSLLATRVGGSADEEVSSMTCSFALGTGPQFVAVCRIPTSGYYHFSIVGALYLLTPSTTDLDLENFSISVDYDSRITCFSKHLINSQLFSASTKVPFFASEQTNAGSMLIKNSTPILSRGGMVYAVSPSSNATWWNSIADNDIRNEMGLTNSRYSGPLEKGIYGWLRPQVRGFRTCNDTQLLGDGTVATTLRSYIVSRKTPEDVFHARGMNLYSLVPPSPNIPGIGGAATPCNVTLISAVHFEYTTLNQTPIQSNHAIGIDHLRAATRMLGDVDVFTENGAHVDAFLSAIRSMAGSVKSTYNKYRSGIVPIFSALSSFGHPVVSGLGKAALAADAVINGNFIMKSGKNYG